MKKGLTELVFILDRSGSMGGLESDTINYEAAGSVLSCIRSDDCSMEEKMLKVSEFLRPITEHLEEDE